MSDNRKTLVAKRQHERSKYTNPPQTNRNNQVFDNNRQGIKRSNPPCDTPKKNLASDRLKRLRTSLSSDVASNSKDSPKISTPLRSTPKNFNNVRKRPQSRSNETAVAVKQPRKQAVESRTPNKSGFVFKEAYLTQRINTEFVSSTESQVPDNDAMEWSTVDEDVAPISHFSNETSHAENESSNKFFVVVDTNIFISHLQIIKDIVCLKILGNVKPVVFIPWIVIEELDFIKEDSNKTSLRFKAQGAVKYIEKTLSSKTERLLGQTLEEVNKQSDAGKNQDNKIIACCLQVMQKNKSLILLTSDINLKNKAHFNNIPVCSHNDIMGKILALNQTTETKTAKTPVLNQTTESKAQKMMNKMTKLCNTVINECAEKAYGVACQKMPICQSLKTLEDCLCTFTKYWFPVFQEHLMKQFKKAVEDLSIFLTNNKNISGNNVNDLLNLCVRICVYLKDVTSCKEIIEHTIRDLNNIKES